MSKRIKKIVIVGGGSAGWMTAATLIARLPGREITLIESPNIPTVGVGEATLGFINQWLGLLKIDDEDFMKHCDATWKLSIRFTDFYKKGAGSFHYPFGSVNTDGNILNKNDWYLKKMFYPETPVSDYADCIYPIMALVNQNKISIKENVLPNYSFRNDCAYHFNAVQFALWLKSNYAIPKGVVNVLAEVKDIKLNEDGIEYLQLDNGEKVEADLFIDCTGFRSVLYGKMDVPFVSLSNILPNNSAWALQVPYTNKRKQLVTYTDCHAIGNGWVWNTPVWSRMGTGYVYSDKYIDDEGALKEFKDHLQSKGLLNGDLNFKKLKFRVGCYEKLWHKNVIPIGLSAGFIEPLESNGLYSVHMFLMHLIRILDRDKDGYVSQFDKDSYTLTCRTMFKGFSEFVALHYALSHRDDTEYWRDVGAREYSEYMYNLNVSPHSDSFKFASSNRMNNYEFDNGGINCIASGMNYFATDAHALNSYYHTDEERKEWLTASHRLNKKRDHWHELVKDEPELIDILKERIYHDEEER
jgi:Tryptophan halogenase